MSNRTIISIFADINTAEKAVDDLTTRGYAREDMGLAVNESSGEALLERVMHFKGKKRYIGRNDEP